MFCIYYLVTCAVFYTWLLYQAEYERGARLWSKWSGRVSALFAAAVLLALSGCAP